jgi:3-methyl-2-oxobutanoate hydroxymethyltransferase
MTDGQNRSPVTLETLRRMQREGEKIACLTCYDSSFARLLEAAGIEVFIIGDSLGMVLMGYESTLAVTLADMLHHAGNVARVGQFAYRVVDMPAGSYTAADTALANAGQLLEQGGADMVKLEGGTEMAGIVAHLVRHDIPVCGHIGLLPQSVEKYGGYKVQGRNEAGARAVLADALALEQAGAGLLVMECIPAELATRITTSVGIPTIGIGAGPGCDGQVLVLHDMLGITPGKRPRFVKDFLAETGSIPDAVAAYVRAVKEGRFPGPGHSY